MISINELQRGDMVIYRNGRINYVNKPYKYQKWYNSDFKHIEYGSSDDIMKVKRYVKGLVGYKQKTIYKRNGRDDSKRDV